jgi:hypothetical protein
VENYPPPKIIFLANPVSKHAVVQRMKFIMSQQIKDHGSHLGFRLP